MYGGGRRPVRAARAQGGFAWLLPKQDGAPGYIGFIAVMVYVLLIVTYYFTGGHIAMKIAIGAVIAAAAFGSLRLRFSAPAIILCLFVCVGWASTTWAIDEPRSAALFEELWKIALIYLVVLQVVNNISRVTKLTAICFGAFVLFPVRGALLNYFGGYRLEGRALWNYVYENSNFLALLVVLGAYLGLAVAHTAPDKRLRILAVMGVLASFAVVILSGSRGTIVALAFSAALYILRHMNRPRIWVAASAVVLITWFTAPETARERLATLARPTDTEAARSVDSGSAKERLAIWETSRQIIEDRTLLGTGFGMYPLAHRYYTTGSLDAGSAHEPLFSSTLHLQDAHNTYVTIWAELGLTGLVLYVAFAGFTLYRLRRVRLTWRGRLPELCRGLEMIELGVVTFLAAAMWGTFVRLAFPYVYFALALCWAIEIERYGKKLEGKRLDESTTFRQRQPPSFTYGMHHRAHRMG